MLSRGVFWLAFGLLLRGEAAQSNGWLARAARLTEDAGSEGVARGYLSQGNYQRCQNAFRR